MKLQRLGIENFGLFADEQLNFNGSGFQLIYGPNEAGKSTLLEVFRGLLFGFPMQSPYVFPEHNGEMAATALVELADGTRLEFRRRKGRKDQVVGRVHGDDREFDAAYLEHRLGSANKELFQNIFGFSLTELISGEKSLASANLNEALYGGGLGSLANFQNVEKVIDDEAAAIFTSSGRTKIIHKLTARIKEKLKRQRELTIRPTDYKKLRDSCEQRKGGVDALNEGLDQLRRREGHLQRLSSALPNWLDLKNIERELAELVVPDGFPLDGAEQYKRAKERGDGLADELAELEQDLAEVTSQLKDLVLAPDVVAREADIQKLEQQVAQIKGFHQSLPKRREKSAQIKANVLDRLRELDPTWDHQALDKYRTGLAERDAVKRLRGELDGLERDISQHQVRRPGVEDDINTLEDELKKLADIESSSQLEALVDQEADYQSNRRICAELTKKHRDLASDLESLKTDLSAPLDSAIDFQEPLAVPLPATVSELRQQIHEATKLFQQAQGNVTAAKKDRHDKQEKLETLDRAESIPDREQLDEARGHRDRGWRIIRRKFVEGHTVDATQINEWLAGSESLADQYEHEVSQTDKLADERQEKSELVAQREQLANEVVRLDRHVQICEEERTARQSDLDELNKQWRELWSRCPFEPLSPEAMLDWLRIHQEFREKSAALAGLDLGIGEAEEKIAVFEQSLKNVFPDETFDSAVLLSQAKRRVQEARDGINQRDTYHRQLRDKKKDLAQLDRELAKLVEARTAWNVRWQALLERCDFPADWDVDLATQILNGLSEARGEYREALSLDQRVGEMTTGVDDFEDQVRALCDELASDLADMPGVVGIVQLSNRVNDGKQAARDHLRLVRENKQLEERIATKRRHIKEVEEITRNLHTAASVETEQEFFEIADRASRQSDLLQHAQNCRNQIDAIRSTDDKEEFEADLASADTDTLANQRRQLAQQIEADQAKYQEEFKSYSVEDERLKQMDAASAAADLSADLEGSRSELAAAVERWAPLVLANALMRRAIERFSREHQPAILGEVERLFNQMTLGRYTGIERKLDEQGTLQLITSGGDRREPKQLSTGTREQLYMAIRLAYIARYCQDAEPLPIVMDDVLVNFDPRRAEQTLDVLVSMSRDIQVIFMTCHQHVVEMVSRVHPECEPVLLSTGGSPSEPIDETTVARVRAK